MSGQVNPHEIRLAALTTAQDFHLTPAGDAVAEALGLVAARKVSFTGQIAPRAKRDWTLTGTLGATVVQPCIATLAPVTTRIETTVTREFVADYTDPDEAEAEMPEDDSREPLPKVLDLSRVLLEALTLALPDYPRADDAAFVDEIAAPPGVAPLTDAEVKPFAGLAELKRRMEED